MRNVFKLAMKAGYIEKNPMELLDPIRPEKPDIDPFTHEEAQAIIENIDPFYKNFATVMFYTGMRFSEAAALRWKNVDFKLGVIKVREALVEGEFDRPKTESSSRDIKMLSIRVGGAVGRAQLVSDDLQQLLPIHPQLSDRRRGEIHGAGVGFGHEKTPRDM